MKYALLVVTLGLAACGGSPTSPTATVTHPAQATTAPQPPADPPAAPTPAPAPAPSPAPTPAPAPAPAPAPPTKTILHATATSSHWYPGASFTLPATFDVVILGDTAKIATLDPLPFAFFDSNENFIVKQTNFEFVVQGGSFAFNGVQGQALGTIVVAK